MKKHLAVLAVFAIAMAFACVAWAEEPPAKKTGPNVGNYLAEFKFENPIDGKTYGLKEIAKNGKDTAIVFMQTACALCMAEVNDFNKAEADLQGKLNVVLVAIDVDKKRIEAFVAGNAIKLPILHDPKAELLDKVDLDSTPSSLLVAADGKILDKKTGYKPADVRGMIKKYSMM